MAAGFAKTPRYVLRDDAQRPSAPMLDASEVDTNVVFGFSNKEKYDAFRAENAGLLKPYPLIGRFLSNQITSNNLALHLIVLDAMFPTRSVLFAATMQAVVDSYRLGSEAVVTSHQLVLDEAHQTYRVHAFFSASAERFVP